MNIEYESPWEKFNIFYKKNFKKNHEKSCKNKIPQYCLQISKTINIYDSNGFLKNK